MEQTKANFFRLVKEYYATEYSNKKILKKILSLVDKDMVQGVQFLPKYKITKEELRSREADGRLKAEDVVPITLMHIIEETSGTKESFSLVLILNDLIDDNAGKGGLL